MSGETWDLIRHGVVVAQDPSLARVKVHFEELEITSDWLPVVQRGAAALGGYWLPSAGDHVVCAFYSDATEEGVVIGSYYPEGAPPSAGAAGVYYTLYPDGSLVKWDNGQLTVTAAGAVTVNGSVTINGAMSINGALAVSGNINANTGIVTAKGFVDLP